MAARYTTPGRLRRGYYLIAKDGRASVVTLAQLPAPGHGFKYYWLGADAGGAQSRLLGALVKLGFTPSTSSGLFSGAKAMPDLSQAVHGPVDVPLAKGGLSGLLHGIPLIVLPPGVIAAGTGDALAGGAEVGAGEAAAGTAAAGGAATLAKNAGGALSGLEQAGTLGAALAALFDPKLLTRIVEIIGGVLLLLLGLRSLTGGSVDPVALARARA